MIPVSEKAKKTAHAVNLYTHVRILFVNLKFYNEGLFSKVLLLVFTLV